MEDQSNTLALKSPKKKYAQQILVDTRRGPQCCRLELLLCRSNTSRRIMVTKSRVLVVMTLTMSC